MQIEKIETKPRTEFDGKNVIGISRNIIIYTSESQEISIEEEAKILEFFRNLRT